MDASSLGDVSVRGSDSTHRLVPIFGPSIVRPVSMNDSPSLGTLDVILSTMIQQLSDYFSKAAPGLHYRDIDVMSVSRIQSSMGLSMLEETAEAERGGKGPESREQKKQRIFLRSCHVLLSCIEETLGLMIAHCEFFLVTDQVQVRRQQAEASKYQSFRGGSDVSTLGNITNMSMSRDMRSMLPPPSASSFEMSAPMTLKISDELAGSVLRSVGKLEKMMDTRMHNAPEEERTLLEEKKSFVALCGRFFSGAEK